MPLPGEVSKATCSYMEKSAEVIVVVGNELIEKIGGLTSSEGPNVNWFSIWNGMRLPHSRPKRRQVTDQVKQE